MPSATINFINDINMLNLFNIRAPRREKIYKIRFNPMNLREKEFRSKYRFSKQNMKKIIELVRTDLMGDKRGGRIPVELQVMAAIRCWGRNEIQDDAADIHGFSQPTLSVVCQRVARALASKRPTFVEMPLSLSDQINEMRGFQNIAGFRDVVGAIDCTHIRIPRVPGPEGEYYVNRKKYYSINTQVVCDSRLKIRDIVCHWRGSTHDARIFRESRIRQRFINGEFSGRLLGDGGYACQNFLFTPLLNPRTDPEKRYNKSHISTRNTVERCFGVWKKRFLVLQNGMRCSLKNSKIVVIALAVLHNLAIEFGDSSLDDEEIPLHDAEVEGEIFEEGSENEDIQPNVLNISRSIFIQQNFS